MVALYFIIIALICGSTYHLNFTLDLGMGVSRFMYSISDYFQGLYNYFSHFTVDLIFLILAKHYIFHKLSEILEI